MLLKCGIGPVKAKASWSGRKVMATIFWEVEGNLLVEQKNTATSAYYESVLRKLAKGLAKKTPWKVSPENHFPP